jgi:hypothetical protein
MTPTFTYCSECGQPLATPSARFCSACGTPAAAPTPVTSALSPISPRVQPREQAAAPATAPTRTPEPPRRRGRNVLLVVLIAVGLVAAFMLGARTNGDTAAIDQLPSDSSPVEPSPVEPSPIESSTADTPDFGSGEPSNQASEPATPMMPSVVGMVLQDAQDLVQSQGSYLMDQVDASGAGRIQFFDNNWKVCSQEPSAGSPLSTIDIVTLRSVKLDQSCP